MVTDDTDEPETEHGGGLPPLLLIVAVLLTFVWIAFSIAGVMAIMGMTP